MYGYIKDNKVCPILENPHLHLGLSYSFTICLTDIKRHAWISYKCHLKASEVAQGVK